MNIAIAVLAILVAGPTTQPVDFHDLKDLLPETLSGLICASSDGELTKIGDFTVSVATADYSSDADRADAPQLSVRIADYVANPQYAAAQARWSGEQIDRRTEKGHERTLKIGDHLAHEKYDEESKAGELQILVGGRFLITVTSTNLPPEQIANVGEALPLDALASLD